MYLFIIFVLHLVLLGHRTLISISCYNLLFIKGFGDTDLRFERKLHKMLAGAWQTYKRYILGWQPEFKVGNCYLFLLLIILCFRSLRIEKAGRSVACINSSKGRHHVRLYCIMYMIITHWRVHCSKSTICICIFALSITVYFAYCLHDDVTMTVFFPRKGRLCSLLQISKLAAIDP
jgi:hypothetical protein